MILRITDEILDAANHLPGGATLVVPNVEWEDYERLLEDLMARPHLRTSYDCGRLEILSPSAEHGEYERLIEDLVTIACEFFRQKLEKRANATWKRRSLSKGAEGDASYYIENATRIIGKRSIDLETDPPPEYVIADIVVQDPENYEGTRRQLL
jgi:Uma2 family endonuclease